MNPDPSPTPPRTRKWWCALIAAVLVGPLLPIVGESIGPLIGGKKDFITGAVVGFILWMIAPIVPSAMIGWHINAHRSTGMRLLSAALFAIAACGIGFGLGLGGWCVVVETFRRNSHP